MNSPWGPHAQVLISTRGQIVSCRSEHANSFPARLLGRDGSSSRGRPCRRTTHVTSAHSHVFFEFDLNTLRPSSQKSETYLNWSMQPRLALTSGLLFALFCFMTSFWKILNLQEFVREWMKTVDFHFLIKTTLFRRTSSLSLPLHQVFQVACYALRLVSVSHDHYSRRHHAVDELKTDGGNRSMTALKHDVK